MTSIRPAAASIIAVLAAFALAACDRRDDVPPPKSAAPGAKAPAPSSPPAAAAPDPGRTAATASATDRNFVEQAGSAGMAEVEITQHVMDKAASAEVRKVAEHLNQDHKQANQELTRIAKEKGITVPSEPSAEKRAEVEKLRGLSGAELDRTVVEKLAESHRSSIKLFEREAAEGADADLKAFAEKTLPTLREHLKMVEGVQVAAKQ